MPKARSQRSRVRFVCSPVTPTSECPRLCERPKARSSRHLALPSLDPPGTQRELQIPFMYKSRPKRREVIPYLIAAEPFNTLPRLLIPTRAVPYKPPVLGYGWRAPRAALFEYARQRKLHQRLGGKVCELESIMHAFPTFAKERWPSLHEHYMRLEWSSIGPVNTNHVLVIVHTNFDLKREDLPSSEEIESIGKVLGVEDRPSWFLIDEHYWGWRLWSEK